MRIFAVVLCLVLSGCLGAAYTGGKRAEGARAFCDAAGFRVGTAGHGDCMVRYVEALLGRVRMDR